MGQFESRSIHNCTLQWLLITRNIIAEHLERNQRWIPEKWIMLVIRWGVHIIYRRTREKRKMFWGYIWSGIRGKLRVSAAHSLEKRFQASKSKLVIETRGYNTFSVRENHVTSTRSLVNEWSRPVLHLSRGISERSLLFLWERLRDETRLEADMMATVIAKVQL